MHRLSHITASFLCWWQFRHASSCTSAHPYPTPPPPKKPLHSCAFYLPSKIRMPFFFSSFKLPLFPLIRSGWRKKKSDLFQRGPKLLHPHSIHPGVSVLKCELNQREESQRPRRAMEQTVIVVGERMCPGSGMSSNRKWGPLECPSSLSLLLPNTKLTSTPTQQHGRPCLRDWSHTAGDTRFRSGPAGLRAAGRRRRKPQRREATRRN